MSVQSLTNNFISMIGQRAKQIATIELFDGISARVNNRLVIDHILPVYWQPEEEYQVHLVARIGYRYEGERFVTAAVRAKGRFTAAQVRDRQNWDIHIETIAQPLVLSLRNAINGLQDPAIHLFPEGDQTDAKHNMNRVWL